MIRALLMEVRVKRSKALHYFHTWWQEHWQAMMDEVQAFFPPVITQLVCRAGAAIKDRGGTESATGVPLCRNLSELMGGNRE